MARNEAEPRTQTELITSLEVTRRRLERADEIENPTVRTEQLERLMEQVDLLEAEIAQSDATIT